MSVFAPKFSVFYVVCDLRKESNELVLPRTSCSVSQPVVYTVTTVLLSVNVLQFGAGSGNVSLLQTTLPVLSVTMVTSVGSL